jgi:hypothetical protein
VVRFEAVGVQGYKGGVESIAMLTAVRQSLTRDSGCKPCWVSSPVLYATSATMDAISDLLKTLNSLKRHKIIDGRDRDAYYPKALVRERVSAEMIEKVLAEGVSVVRESQRKRYASLMRENALLVFCILCSIHHERFICDFLHERLYDTRLCFESSQLEFLASTNNDACVEFMKMQWAFTPFEFSKGMIHARIMPETILPYRHDKCDNNGAFGVIYKVKIDTDCHNLFEDSLGVSTMIWNHLFSTDAIRLSL